MWVQDYWHRIFTGTIHTPERRVRKSEVSVFERMRNYGRRSTDSMIGAVILKIMLFDFKRNNIVITPNKTLRFLLLLTTVMLITMMAVAKSQASPSDSRTQGISYNVPTTRTDGSPLAISEIAGFNLYCGIESGNYQLIQTVTSDITSLTATVSIDQRYCAMTTTDTDTLEGPYSDEFVLTAPPESPGNIITILINIGVQ